MTTDQVKPEGRWEFNEEVTACFENMLERSIPQYQIMRETVTNLAVRYAREDSCVLDLGTSRGGALAPIIERLAGPRYRFMGTELSEPMLAAATERFAGMENVDIVRHDLRDGAPNVNSGHCSVVMAVLTLQFTPIEYRQRIVQGIYDSLLPGGAFIFVEKILGSTDHINRMMVSEYYASKSANGYDQEKIDAKRRSLEGVLVPITAEWNTQLLRSAGFQHVDCFWRWMNFAGWVGVK